MSTVGEIHSPTARPATTRSWFPVLVLTLSTFLVVTSEMLPVGVLTPISEGLGISQGTTGFSLAVTGVVAAVTAPFVSRVIGDLDRRTVLVAAVLVLAAGNLITALATGFGVLALGRVVVGIAMAAVWALAAATASRVVTERFATTAVSTVVSGVAAASVLGVPLGTFVGDLTGWRSAFGMLVLTALLLATGLARVLPPLPSQTSTAGSRPGGSLLAIPAVRIGLIAVTCVVTAHFAAYTYVRPILEKLTGIHGAAVSLLLLVYGLCGIVTNFVAGATAAHRARATLFVLATGIVAALLAVLFFGASPVGASIALIVWGLAYGGVSVCSQLWAIQAAPDQREKVTGLYVGAFTGSIALGSFLGGVIFDSAGLPVLLWGSAGVAAVAALATIPGRLGEPIASGRPPGRRS